MGRLAVDNQLPHTTLPRQHRLSKGNDFLSRSRVRVGEDGLAYQFGSIRMHDIVPVVAQHDGRRVGVGLDIADHLRQPLQQQIGAEYADGLIVLVVERLDVRVIVLIRG